MHKKILLFPLILLIFLLTLTCLKISGTSSGIYHEYLYGDTRSDPNLLYGKPQNIRSDEWLVNTQLTIAQEKNDYGRINKNFNEDKDMSILADSPYREWSSLFRPQNFSFFVMPLEYAFAFKWWFLLMLLMLSVYFFSLKILPGKILIAVLSAVIIGTSPFVAWWYLTGTIATLAYGFLILLISMSIVDQKKLSFRKRMISKRLSVIIKIAILSYLLVSFCLILYPPFQIPVALVVIFFMLGYLINNTSKNTILPKILPFIVSLLVSGLFIGLFLSSHLSVIQSIGNTAYPGKRIINTGGYDIKKLLTTYLQPQLQREDRGENYDKNQSESSSFIVLPLYFIFPSIGLLVWLYFKKGRFEWTLFFLIVCSLVFLAHLFIPGVSFLSKILFLNLVPLYRVAIGLGMLSIVMIIYMIKVASENKLFMTKRLQIAVLIYSFIFFGFMIWAGLETAKLYPEFVASKRLILLLSGALMLGLSLILLNKPRIGLTILAIFSVLSVINVNPIYRGLGPLYDSDITRSVQNLSPADSTWAAAQDILIENVPQMSGRAAVTGVSTYPNNAFWRNYSSNNTIYNRYAHIVLSSNDASSLVLVTPDLITVSANCSRKIAREIDYIISTSPLPETCNKLIKKIAYPRITFYYYRQ